jgi:hypothetical protein
MKGIRSRPNASTSLLLKFLASHRDGDGDISLICLATIASRAKHQMILLSSPVSFLDSASVLYLIYMGCTTPNFCHFFPELFVQRLFATFAF